MKRIILFIAIVIATLPSCKNDKPKDIIVKKWKLTDIVPGPGQTMSDSDKAKWMQMELEFTPDGKLLVTGESEPETYTLSEDGKYLTTVYKGKTEYFDVTELSNSKLSLTDKSDGSKASAVPK